MNLAREAEITSNRPADSIRSGKIVMKAIATTYQGRRGLLRAATRLE